ncbi:MAG: hypothetical protein ACFB4I_17970 [Cyanophyceae cyanobacterium]
MSNQQSTINNLLLVLVWIVVGAGLRLTNLELKPPWADEWATIVFSLGHSFRSVPLNEMISVEALLQPLQLDGTTQAGDVVEHLMTESTHPPLYFVLTHWWLKLTSEPGLVSVWAVRSLSALFGVAAIPAMFGLGWLAGRSLFVGQISAALMAVSPYGIYLAQEARHYTLAILWIIASLCCLIVAIRHVRQHSPPPILVIAAWVIVNSLGVATHYFFALTLSGEIVVLLGFWLQDIQKRLTRYWLRIYAAVVGTFIGSAVWLSAWRSIPDNDLTQWIYHGNPLGSEFFEPIGRLCAWIVTMLFLLPVEGTPLLLTIISSVVILCLLLWLCPLIVASWQRQMQQPSSRLTLQILGGFVIGVLAQFLLITYTIGTDLTLAARYQFIYFPAFLVLIGLVLADSWQSQKTSVKSAWFLSRGKRVLSVTLLASFISGVIVIYNLGYQKADRPDLVAPLMLEAQRSESDISVLIATVHKTHEQTGEMIGLAWELQRRSQSLENFRFLLAHQSSDEQVIAQTLYRAIAELPRPFQLWIVNFAASSDLKGQNCLVESDFKGKVSGYQYRLYDCLRSQ